MFHFVSLLLALALLAAAPSSRAEAPTMFQPPMEDTPAGPGGHEGFFSSISPSISLMMLDWNDGPLSTVGAGMGGNVIAGYGLGRLAPFAEVSYEATVVGSDASNRPFDESSFAFLSVGPGLALILDEALITASWLFHAKATGRAVIEGERYRFDVSGRGVRFSATALIRTPFRWGIGLGSYMQFLSLTSGSDDAAFSGFSFGLTANVSLF